MNLMLNFPNEIKNYDQWFIANEKKAPCKLINGQLIVCDPNDAKFGGYTFLEAMYIHELYGHKIGFYLTENDPFCCIDIDIKNFTNCDNIALHTTSEQLERFSKIISYFDTYCEKSKSGIGYHVWFKAQIGPGVRRDNVEIYSQNRFIICTGDAINAKGVEDRQNEANNLVAQIRSLKDNHNNDLIEVESNISDIELYNKALSAENGDKFDILWRGDWIALNYPSQSEADLSLMSMLAFYSKSNEQCRRVFRKSGLGQREKATKNNYYVDRMLSIIRNRQDLEEKERLATAEMAKQLVDKINNSKNNESESHDDFSNFKPDATNFESDNIENDCLDYPPGTVGMLAEFIFKNSIRPIREISIATAIGIMAGMCGKAWNITKSGLNMYIVLVARSGVGKETLHTGTSYICEKLKERIVGADKFFNFSSYVSGPALTKAVVANPCFLNINGEFGRQLKRLANDTVNSPMQQLRTALTHLYQKSDANSSVGGLEYSDKNLNVNSAKGVAYSMIGETTPDTFFESLTRDMMEDGFLSRFTIIEYLGKRPESNKNLILEIPDDLLLRLESICNQAIKNISCNTVTMVTYSAKAKLFLDSFDKECDDAINNNVDEGIRQIWNRAHLKCCRLAALLAVADNWLSPVVQYEHVVWAHNLICRDMRNIFNKIQRGDIGVDDDAKIKKLLSFVKQYGTKKCSKAFVSHPELQEKGIITRSDIQRKLCNLSTFRNSQYGATHSLDKTINVMIDMGLLAQAGGELKNENSKFRGKAYYILEDAYNYTSGDISGYSDR